MNVHNDLLLAADNGDISTLCLLDLTAAFDTVDHGLMMLRLECQLESRTRPFHSIHRTVEWTPLSSAVGECDRGRSSKAGCVVYKTGGN